MPPKLVSPMVGSKKVKKSLGSSMFWALVGTPPALTDPLPGALPTTVWGANRKPSTAWSATETWSW